MSLFIDCSFTCSLKSSSIAGAEVKQLVSTLDFKLFWYKLIIRGQRLEDRLLLLWTLSVWARQVILRFSYSGLWWYMCCRLFEHSFGKNNIYTVYIIWNLFLSIENIFCVSAANKWNIFHPKEINFISPHGHVIFVLLCKIFTICTTMLGDFPKISDHKHSFLFCCNTVCLGKTSTVILRFSYSGLWCYMYCRLFDHCFGKNNIYILFEICFWVLKIFSVWAQQTSEIFFISRKLISYKCISAWPCIFLFYYIKYLQYVQQCLAIFRRFLTTFWRCLKIS